MKQYYFSFIQTSEFTDSEAMTSLSNEIERRLWEVADQLRANSRLKSSEYSGPVLGLIFLRFADYRFTMAQQELGAAFQQQGSRRNVGKNDYQALGVMYLPEKARFGNLLQLPEGENIGGAINEAMRLIEGENEELRGVLPKDYSRLDNDTLATLLKAFAGIRMDLEGDVFGKIYEYFLGKFAMAEGQRGGEFFTPTSLVKLIVEVMEPFHGKILDPACGSGGMFVQSADFVRRHQRNPSHEISIHGQDKVAETVRLCRMNLSVHGLAGDIKQGNSYYEDVHQSPGAFDYVMANPPFNVDGVDKEKIAGDPRFSNGIPRVDNANYLWIQIFWSTLKEKGRAGFVMASSATDSRGSEFEIRRKLIEDHAVDVMIAVGPKFFYNVGLPCTLWFLERGKSSTDRRDRILFIDARSMYQQIDRAHREFTPQQIEFLANIVRLYRGEEPENVHGSANKLRAEFPEGHYSDVPGLCKAAQIGEMKTRDWSLNPGRYVGIAEGKKEDFDLKDRLEELNEELEVLNGKAKELESDIAENLAKLLEA